MNAANDNICYFHYFLKTLVLLLYELVANFFSNSAERVIFHTNIIILWESAHTGILNLNPFPKLGLTSVFCTKFLFFKYLPAACPLLKIKMSSIYKPVKFIRWKFVKIYSYKRSIQSVLILNRTRAWQPTAIVGHFH